MKTKEEQHTVSTGSPGRSNVMILGGRVRPMFAWSPAEDRLRLRPPECLITNDSAPSTVTSPQLNNWTTLMRTYEPSSIPFLMGLDLAQRQDFTALVLLERVDSFGEWDGVTWSRPVSSALHVRFIHRFPRNTPYPGIVDFLQDLLQDPRIHNKASLVVDATGVGGPVVDLIKQARIAANLYPIVITGGEAATSHQSYSGVPKKDLVSAVAIMLQQKALVIPKRLPFAEVLIDELINFRSTISSNGHTAYAAWRERDHDDLVLAMALACWKARQIWPLFNTGWERQPCPRP